MTSFAVPKVSNRSCTKPIQNFERRFMKVTKSSQKNVLSTLTDLSNRGPPPSGRRDPGKGSLWAERADSGVRQPKHVKYRSKNHSQWEKNKGLRSNGG